MKIDNENPFMSVPLMTQIIKDNKFIYLMGLGLFALFFIFFWKFFSLSLILKFILLFCILGSILVFCHYPRPLLYLLVLAFYLPHLPGMLSLHHNITNYLSTAEFHIYLLDLIAVLIIIVAILKRHILLKGFLHTANLEHLSLVAMLIGILPIIMALLNGHANFLYGYRLYLYFSLGASIPVLLKNQQSFKRLIHFIIALNGIVVTHAFVTSFIFEGFDFGYLINTRFMNLFCVLILFSLLFYKKKSIFQKVAVFILLPLFFLVLLIDQTRMIYVGLVIGLFVILVYNFKEIWVRKNKIALLATLLILVLLLLPNGFGIVSQAYDRALSSFNLEGKSIGTRLNATKALAYQFLQSPIVGKGYGLRTPYIRPTVQETYYGAYHTFHMKVLAMGGVVGYGLLLLLSFQVFVRGQIVCRKSKGFLKVLSLAMLSTFVSYFLIISATVFGVPNIVRLWFFGGLTLSTYNLFRKKAK